MIPRRPSDMKELPLTALQLRWWFLGLQYRGGSSPLVALVHRLRGPLDVEAWTGAVSRVVDRHEILRTRFVGRVDGPVQVVSSPAGIGTERVDLCDGPVEGREERARELLMRRRARPLDLEKDQLVDSCLVRLADDDHVWTMTIHHILADGFSLAAIDRELATLYPGAGEPPPLPVQYGDFAVWQSTSDAEREAEDRAYWQSQLAGAPPLDLFDARPRPPEKGAPAAEVAHMLDPELVRQIEGLAKSARASRFMVLLAALHLLLARASGQTDFCVGIPVAGVGRIHPELAPLVGLFSNTLALRCDLSGDPTFREHLARTREVVLDALDHQDLPWGEVVAAIEAPQDPGRAQVFQVMLLHDDVEVASRLDLPGVRVEEFPLGIPRVLHDIMVYARPSGGGLQTRFVYDTALFSPELMAGLAHGYEELLHAAVMSPDSPLSELAAE